VVVELKELYEETVASQLKVWDEEIAHLDARADIILAQTEEHYYCMLRSLRAKECELRSRLEALRSAAGDDWRTREAELARITEELKCAIGHAAEELDGV
jgi:hypothetical protein